MSRIHRLWDTHTLHCLNLSENSHELFTFHAKDSNSTMREAGNLKKLFSEGFLNIGLCSECCFHFNAN